MEMIDRINLIIEEKKVSKTEIGKRLGKTKQNVGYRLNKNQIDSVDFLKVICELSGSTLEYLVYGIEECKYINLKAVIEENKKLKDDNEFLKNLVKHQTGLKKPNE
jgi:transcriptional regulator with XRE-family HTH domain